MKRRERAIDHMDLTAIFACFKCRFPEEMKNLRLISVRQDRWGSPNDLILDWEYTKRQPHGMKFFTAHITLDPAHNWKPLAPTLCGPMTAPSSG